MEHILLQFCKVHGLSQKFPNILRTILVSQSIKMFIKLCGLFALKWNTNLFYSLCNSWLGNVEVLRDRPGRQVPVNLDCGRQKFGRRQWMDDRRGQHRQRIISPKRKRANQHWQMSALMTESSYTHISHAVRPFLLFLSGRKKCAENAHFDSPFSTNSAHIKHIQTQQSIWRNVKRCLTCQRVCGNPRFEQHKLSFLLDKRHPLKKPQNLMNNLIQCVSKVWQRLNIS